MNRGEIWWADLPAPAQRRPVVLLSRDEAYAIRDLITVSPVTPRVRNIPSEVTLGKEDGLPKDGVVNLDFLSTISKQFLDRRIATLSPEKLHALETALKFSLGLDD
jgi:mRNA interferase MazF